MTNKNQIIFGTVLVGLLSALPLLGMFAPRALAYAPSIFGLAGFLAYRPVFGSWPQISKHFAAPAGAFVLLMGASILWALDPQIAAERTLKVFLVFFGGLCLFSTCLSLERMAFRFAPNIVPPAIIVAGLFLVIDSYTQGGIYRFLHGLKEAGDFSASSLNRSTVLFLFTAFIAWFVLWQSRSGKSNKIQLVILTFLMAMQLWITDSQTAHLSVAVAALSALLLPCKNLWGWRAVKAALVAGLLGAPWIASWMYAHFLPLVQDIDWFQTAYAAPRLEIWNFIAARIFENPIYGFGVEATRAIQDFETQARYHASNTVLHPHNFALQLWIEFGVLGALLAGTAFVVILDKVKTLGPPCARLYTALLLSMICAAATSYGLWQGWWLGTFNLLLAFCAIILKLYETKTKAE